MGQVRKLRLKLAQLLRTQWFCRNSDEHGLRAAARLQDPPLWFALSIRRRAGDLVHRHLVVQISIRGRPFPDRIAQIVDPVDVDIAWLVEFDVEPQLIADLQWKFLRVHGSQINPTFAVRLDDAGFKAGVQWIYNRRQLRFGRFLSRRTNETR